MMSISRGKCVEILTSSAAGRTHPAAGDKGFISNAYLCPNEKFVICDIYFFQYGNEMRARCERKLFIMNLGINKTLKHTLAAGLTRSAFQTLAANHVNLTPTFLAVPSGLRIDTWPHMYGNASLFRGPIRRTLDRSMAAMVKIPFGEVKCVNTRKGISGLTALSLFRSVRPVVNDITRMLPLIHGSGTRTWREALDGMLGADFAYAPVHDCFAPALSSVILNPIREIQEETLLEKTRKIQCMAELLLRRSTDAALAKIIRAYEANIARNPAEHHRMASSITHSGLGSWFNIPSTSISERTTQAIARGLAHLAYKVMFSSKTAEEVSNFFTQIQSIGGISPADTPCISVPDAVRKIVECKANGVKGSAALARLLEENILF